MFNEKSKNIISFGASVDHNFGGPCILAGLSQLLKSKSYDLVHYQHNPPCGSSYMYIDFDIKHISARPRSFLIGVVIYRVFGTSLQGKECDQLFYDLKAADMVVDLWGIEFAEQLMGGKSGGFFKALINVMGQYRIAFAARILGTPVLKSSSSFGPMKSAFSKRCAYIYTNFILSKILARELSGMLALQSVGVKKEILLSPDFALAFNINNFCDNTGLNNTPIGISVSYRVA